MKHPDKFIVPEIIGVPKESLELTNQEVADTLSNLRYDVLADILDKLFLNLKRDAKKDWDAGRTQLADCLNIAKANIDQARTWIVSAWDICEPYEK